VPNLTKKLLPARKRSYVVRYYPEPLNRKIVQETAFTTLAKAKTKALSLIGHSGRVYSVVIRVLSGDKTVTELEWDARARDFGSVKR
jgi:hypothetical protein